MFTTVELPLWLLVLILGFAAVTFASHFLFPSVRWFFRRRMERAVDELNKRLERPIQPFKLMRRQDMINRLIYDPQVMEAVVRHAQDKRVPESVAFQRARSYAREIVPAFSATTYFGVAIRMARALSDSLYDVRVDRAETLGLRTIDRRASVVFVMNHRSNMDYVLVTHLAAERSALSYAVGEWARVWPLQGLIRAMGAYFIRRRYLSPLYLRVLSRYVQMATKEGVTQAIFPEGGLSLDGRVGPARKGLLHYILTDFDVDDGRDVVFVPVAINYDRVLEDRVLQKAATAGRRQFRASLPAAARFAARLVWLRLRGRFHRFGTAAVVYGPPLSLEAFVRASPGVTAHALADQLMGRIRDVVPVLPVPFAALVLMRAGGHGPIADLALAGAGLAARLAERGVHLHLGPDPARSVGVGLEALMLRGLVTIDAGQVAVAPREADIVAFYANSIAHHADAAAASGTTASGVPEFAET